jgi:proline racemase
MRVRRLVSTIDTHTAGGPTRTVTGGLPRLRGATVAERMACFAASHDEIRLFLMREPRGHADMYGAIFTEPGSDDADAGLFFMTPTGYLQACVHSTIGAVAAGLHAGLLSAPAAGDALSVEVPAGTVRVRTSGSHLEGRLAVQTPPAWLHCRTDVAGETGNAVTAAVVFSGAFFLLVDRESLAGGAGTDAGQSGLDAVPQLRRQALNLLAAADAVVRHEHPTRGPQPLGYVMIHERTGERSARSIVVSRAGAVDRTPCGAGTAALAAALFATGELPTGETFHNESLLGTTFQARILGAADVVGCRGAIPEVEGSAFITGMHSFVLDERDPLPHGFHIQEMGA